MTQVKERIDILSFCLMLNIIVNKGSSWPWWYGSL